MDGVVDCDLFWVEEPFVEAEHDLVALRSFLDRAGLATLIADGEGVKLRTRGCSRSRATAWPT